MRGTVAAVAGLGVLAAIALCSAGSRVAPLMAQDQPKVEPKTELKRIELTEPGVYKDSDCLYVMTQDIVATGCGFTFEGNRCVVDLDGHTLTFNTEPYPAPAKPQPGYGTAPWGIALAGDGIELRNGTILQGAGKTEGAVCVFLPNAKERNLNIHHLSAFVDGRLAACVFGKWGGTNVELHDNYLVCADDCLARGINLYEVGTGWDIHHNTIVGGHTGIGVGGRRDKEDIRIHHNYISHRRTRQQKTPQGIQMNASGIEVDHNEIVSIEGRGLNNNAGGNNDFHHNIVDVRYSLKAEGGFYPENRCYGYWSRNPEGNRITDNLFVVNNEITGDDASGSIGILLTTDVGREAPMRNCTITGNRLFVRHSDKARYAAGFELTHVGDQVVVKDNWVWAGTAAVVVNDQSRGAVVEGNTFVKADEKWQEAEPAFESKGEGLKQCSIKGNKIVPPPDDKVPPAAPAGLAVTRRFNGYELHWDANKEDDVLGYYVYRDGKRVEDRMKCGRFYVDTSMDPKNTCVYAISAVDLSGNEGPKGAPVSTAAAK